MKKFIFILFGSLPLFFNPTTVYSQWSTDPNTNNVVCVYNGAQGETVSIPDGSGGAIIAWCDNRPWSQHDIYAQRINANGVLQWTTTGVPVCIESHTQYTPSIVSDGAGGAIIVWYDYRNGPTFDIYAQRISSTGSILWATDGVAICIAANHQTAPRVTPDGTGGAFFAWTDLRNGSHEDIYAQKVSSAGVPLWTTNGVLISGAAANQSGPHIVSDGLGGAYFTWHDLRAGTPKLYVQKMNSAGTPQWTADGMAICSTGGSQAPFGMMPDNSGGFIIGWNDSRNGNGDLYIQNINSSGISLWTPDGNPICVDTSYQGGYQLLPDGSNGGVFAWLDGRNGANHLYGQRFNSSGIAQWTTNGVPIFTSASLFVGPSTAPDGSGGIVLAWHMSPSGSINDIYAQRINGSGVVMWNPGGVPVCTAPNNQFYPTIVSDENNGAIVAWSDIRPPYIDANIFAQRVNPFGTLCGFTPTVSVSATPAGTICLGNNVTFTASITGGGSSPTYQWKLNGSSVGTNSNTYSNSGLINGDTITCTLTSNDSCATSPTVVSSLYVASVNSLVSPTINIVSTSAGTICSGDSITFTSGITNGGTLPAYQWQLNGMNLSGDTLSSFSTTTLLNGDSISCLLTSNEQCLTMPTVSSNNIIVTVNPTPLVYPIASPNDTLCIGSIITLSGSGASTYIWSGGINDGIPFTVVPDTFSVIGTDINGCTDTATITISVNPSAGIYGSAGYTGGPITSGTAILYNYGSSFGMFDTVQIQSLDGLGNYYFNGVLPGDYLVKIYSDTIVYPDLTSTYFFDQWVWDSATVITHQCVEDTFNITMIELNLGGGFGLLHGQIIEGYGWGRNLGDPISNLDVKLAGFGGSQVVECAVTDVNGEFTFTNVPPDNYSIIVDIPGLERTLIHNVTVDSTNNQYLCLDYIVDSAFIFYPAPCSATNTSGIEENSSEENFSVYPNPTMGNVIISYDLWKNSTVQLNIYNSIGLKVSTPINTQQSAGNFQYNLNLDDSLRQGVYFITLTINGKTSTQRMVLLD